MPFLRSQTLAPPPPPIDPMLSPSPPPPPTAGNSSPASSAATPPTIGTSPARRRSLRLQSSPAPPIDAGLGIRKRAAADAGSVMDSASSSPLINSSGKRKCPVTRFSESAAESSRGNSDTLDFELSPINGGGSQKRVAGDCDSRVLINADTRVFEDSPSPALALSSPVSPHTSVIKGSGKRRRAAADIDSRVYEPGVLSPGDVEKRDSGGPALASSSPVIEGGSKSGLGTSDGGVRLDLNASPDVSVGFSTPAAVSVPSQRRRSLRLAAALSASPLPAPSAEGGGYKVFSSELEERGGTHTLLESARASDASTETQIDGGVVDLNLEPNVIQNGIENGERHHYEEKGKERMEFEIGQGAGIHAMDVDLTGEVEEKKPSVRKFSAEEKGKAKLKLEIAPLGNDMVVDLTSEDEESMLGGRRFTAEEKGKSTLVIDKDWLSLGRDGFELDEEEFIAAEMAKFMEMDEEQALNEGGSKKRKKKARVRSEYRKRSDRNKALELAPKFAHFKADDEDVDGENPEEAGDAGGAEDWPGPFSTAMKIIADREAMKEARKAGSVSKKSVKSKISWTPVAVHRPKKRVPPSLKDLCLKILCENVEEIESLEGVPDTLKQKLGRMLCHSKKMSVRAFGLLVSGSPAKIQLDDGTWATEEQIQGGFAKCNKATLEVIQLDMFGRCMTDYVLHDTLAHSPNCLSSLTSLSLQGAYRVTDEGLITIATSAPSLSSINLSQCSLLTSQGIVGLANKLDCVLRELYIDDCQTVDAMLILPALKKLHHLELLSVSHVPTVCDKFVKQFILSSGPNMKTLGFAGCSKLTLASMKIIGEKCSGLNSLDLRYLNRLNDSAIGHIANGCKSLQRLKLRRNGFSDEAVAAFLELSGEALAELSLNSVVKVGEHTALAISRRCSALTNLDLSFCRIMADEALGLIVDSCPNLKILKLFGCTQVTDRFLEGHSNLMVKIIGLKEPILSDIEMTDSF